jgi:hypothetical protein
VASPNEAIVSFFVRQNLERRDSLIVSLKARCFGLAEEILRGPVSLDAVNIVTSDGTPLGIAAASGDLHLVNLLLSVPGIDALMPNLRGDSPFVIACRHGHVSVFTRLAEFCAEALADDAYTLNAGFFCSRPHAEIHVSRFLLRQPLRAMPVEHGETILLILMLEEPASGRSRK